MERFEVKRGLVKQVDSQGGLERLASEHFDEVHAGGGGGFGASFGMLKNISAHYSDDGKLVVEVDQLRGEELNALLESEGGRERAMESRRRWSEFLDAATGYNGKQRGDKAKEQTKKLTKSKAAIKMAHKIMSLSSSLSDEKIKSALELIAEIETKLDEGNATRAMSLSDKLNRLLGS